MDAIEEMKGAQDRNEQSRLLNGPALSISGGLLKTGGISLLVHLFLIAFLTLGLITKHTKGGSVVYRVTLQRIPPQSDSAPKTIPLPIPAKPQIPEEENRPKQLIKQNEVVVEKKSLDSEIQPPTQTVTPENSLEEQNQPLRPQEKEQAPIPLPLGETSIPDKDLNIKVEDNPPVHISLSHLGEERRSTNSSAGSGEQSGEGGPSSAGSGHGPGLGRKDLGGGESGNGSGTGRGSGIPGFGDGRGQGSLGWMGSGTGAGIGNGGSGGFGSGGFGSGSGTGRPGSGGVESGNLGTSVSHPRHAENPKPLYPLEAREKGYKGEVLLKVEVLSNGLVGQIEVKKSSGHEMLDQSALSTVKKWKFIPAKRGEVTIPAWVNIPVRFELQ